MVRPPDPNPPLVAGSPGQTLARRVPEIPADRLAELARELTDIRLVDLGAFNTMMTGRGAEDLAGRITPFGRRFLTFITTD